MTNENNKIKLVGKIVTSIDFSHKVVGERFYKFELSISRLSKIEDIIPIIVSERVLYEDISIGDTVAINGDLRSFNQIDNEGKFHLKLYGFAKEIQKRYYQDNLNEISLRGYFCREPIYRKTPFDRAITDLMIAVNRRYNKSDYIPCIVWGRSAKYLEKFPVGTEIELKGRIQSREYIKRAKDGESISRTVIEISVRTFELIN